MVRARGLCAVLCLMLVACQATNGGSAESSRPESPVDLDAVVVATLEDGPVHYLVETGSSEVHGSGDLDVASGESFAEHHFGTYVDGYQTDALLLRRRSVDGEVFVGFGDEPSLCWFEWPGTDPGAYAAKLLGDLEPSGPAEGSSVPVTASLSTLLATTFAGVPEPGWGRARDLEVPVGFLTSSTDDVRIEGTARVVDGQVASVVVQMDAAAAVLERRGTDPEDVSLGWLREVGGVASLSSVTVSFRPADGPVVVEPPAAEDMAVNGCDLGDFFDASAEDDVVG